MIVREGTWWLLGNSGDFAFSPKLPGEVRPGAINQSEPGNDFRANTAPKLRAQGSGRCVGFSEFWSGPTRSGPALSGARSWNRTDATAVKMLSGFYGPPGPVVELKSAGPQTRRSTRVFMSFPQRSSGKPSGNSPGRRRLRDIACSACLLPVRPCVAVLCFAVR